MPRTKDVAGVTGVRTAYQTLNTGLGLSEKPVAPSVFVARLASALDSPDRVRQRARTLADAAESAGLTVGMQPAGFAGACLYKASHEHGQLVTQSQVAAVADTTAVTIRTHRDTIEDLDL